MVVVNVPCVDGLSCGVVECGVLASVTRVGH